MSCKISTAPMIRLTGLAITLALSSGCMLGASNPAPPTRYYDLGNGPVGAVNCSYDLSINVVETHAHLRGNKMWYRRADTPFELAAYAISRWVAPPSQMLMQRLRSAFQHDLHDTSRSAPLMHANIELRLTRMELAIDTSTEIGSQASAHSIIELSASIVSDGERSGSQLFRLQEPAAASPAGSAEAMARALDKFPIRLCSWLVDHERPPTTVLF